MNVIEIAQIILLLSASALCVFLIIYIGRITESVKEIKFELNKLTNQINPLLDSLQVLSSSIVKLSNQVQSQLDKTAWIIDEVKDRVESLFVFERKIRDTVEGPANTLFQNLEAIKKGLSVFWQSLFRR